MTNLSIHSLLSVTVNDRAYVVHSEMNLSGLYIFKDENDYLSKILFNIHLSPFLIVASIRLQ